MLLVAGQYLGSQNQPHFLFLAELHFCVPSHITIFFGINRIPEETFFLFSILAKDIVVARMSDLMKCYFS